MNSLYIFLSIIGYFFVLFLISIFTSKKADNTTFFSANRSSPWYLVAYGMIGASLSGLTFLSIPGAVKSDSFSYMQIVFGYFFGYVIISQILLPIYYKNNLVSIYTYIEERFGKWSYKTAAITFLVSRMLGSSLRMYLVALVLDHVLIKPLQWDVPFAVTVLISIALVWVYTFKGGIKTIVFTDTLQTTFMILSVVCTIYFIAQAMHLNIGDLFIKIQQQSYSKIFFIHDINDSKHFIKNFLSGVFITVVMTGLDQDMMQKNLTCKNLQESQKNMRWFSVVLVVINYVFLCFGAALFMFSEYISFPIPEKTDLLFSSLAFSHYLPGITAFLFIIGLIAAAYSSADSALTAMTTSVCYDILGVRENNHKSINIRKLTHILVSITSVLVILLIHQIQAPNAISILLKIAGYTYGPLLGLFAFGIFTKKKLAEPLVPIIFILSPLACYLLKEFERVIFSHYTIGFELLLINGLLTYILLWTVSKK